MYRGTTRVNVHTQSILGCVFKVSALMCPGGEELTQGDRQRKRVHIKKLRLETVAARCSERATGSDHSRNGFEGATMARIRTAAARGLWGRDNRLGSDHALNARFRT